MRHASGPLLCLVLFLLFSPVQAHSLSAQNQEPGKTPLAGAIPEDVYIFVHGVHHPERQAIDNLWNPVVDALVEAEIHKDLLDLVRGILDPEERDEFDGMVDSVTSLIEGVDWLSLLSREVVYASRMGMPVADYLVLFRCDPDKVERNMAGLREILRSVSSLDQSIRLKEEILYGAQAWKMIFSEAPFPLSLILAQKGDVIVLSLGGRLAAESLALLAGESELPRLVESERYKKAMALLPPPEDLVSFWDPTRTFGPIRDFFKFKVAREVDKDEEALAAIKLVDKVFGIFEVFESMASVEFTDHDQKFAYEAVLVKPGFERSLLGKLHGRQKPLNRFDRFVPKEALGFEAGRFIDLEALYEFALDFIGNEVPHGDRFLDKWKALQEKFAFHPAEDIFVWLGSRFVSVTLPPSRPAPLGGTEAVFLLEVRDAEKAETQLSRGIEALSSLLKKAGQPLIIQEAKVAGAEGFKSITHPMIMAFLNVVVGVQDEHLILGTSPEAVSACLAAARGEQPSILENPRFAAEGLKPAGETYAISFTDQSKLGQEIAGLFQGLSMGLSMSMAFVAQEEPKLGQVLLDIGKILGKLGPVAAQVDFYRSSSSITQVGEGYELIKTVTNYRLPDEEEGN